MRVHACQRDFTAALSDPEPTGKKKKVPDTVSLKEGEWSCAERWAVCFLMFVQVLWCRAQQKKNKNTQACPSCDCVINSLEWARCHFEVTHGRLLWYTAGFSRGYPESPGDLWTHTHTCAHMQIPSYITHRSNPRGVVCANTQCYTPGGSCMACASVCVCCCAFYIWRTKIVILLEKWGHCCVWWLGWGGVRIGLRLGLRSEG